ncbi:mitochondrial ribosomal protein S11 [Rhynchophorus ferrugineus]|uniref:28S ribosomal protein S11, mitochondrial n=1 Tax=Rhynchophorus ferrugineus TaxID=354439 RepID=A0A834MG99_RHYFE|nr:hypothetical protein GWI33_007946 [Rhynchophorus ferrugineus]
MFRKTFTGFLRVLPINNNILNNSRTICISSTYCRDVTDRKEMLKSMPVIDEGTAGEKSLDMDLLIDTGSERFPTSQMAKKQFGGVYYNDIPILNITVSHNNTIINYTNSKGVPEVIRSCGIEGFKNTRKGTNIAAQATAISIGTRVLEKGIKTVRVRVCGIGPGRMSAIKGLQMSGLNIVSITDNTRVSWNPPRPRKQRKL